MLTALLSVEFTCFFAGGLIVALLLAMMRISSGTRHFIALVHEFANLDPQSHSPESLRDYRVQVLQAASPKSALACGSWANFLSSVDFVQHGARPLAITDTDSVHRLRDDLITAYASTYKVTRLHSSLLSGSGFAGMLLIAFASALTSRSYLLSGRESALSNALALLISAAGLAFICAMTGIVCSMIFKMFERSQAAYAERFIDALVTDLRLRFAIRTAHDQVSNLSQQIDHYAGQLSALTSSLGEHLGAAGKPSELATDIIKTLEKSAREAAQELASHVSSAIQAQSDNMMASLTLSQSNTEAQSRSLGEVLEQVVDLGTSQTRVWETALRELQDQTSAIKEQSSNLMRLEKTTDSMSQLASQIAQQRTTLTGGPTMDLAPVVDALVEVRSAIEELDHGLEEDVDDLLASAKMTRSAMHHLIHDEIAPQLDTVTKHLEKRHEWPPSTKESHQPDVHRIELDVAALEAAVARGLTRVQHRPVSPHDEHHPASTRDPSPGDALPPKKPEPKAKSTANKKESSAPRGKAPRTKRAPKVKTKAPRPDKKRNIIKRATGKAELTNTYQSQGALQAQLGLIVGDIAATRRTLLVHATGFAKADTPDIVAVLASIERIIHMLREQNAARSARYGKAYEPLAQSNALAESILSSCCDHIRDFARPNSDAPAAALLMDPIASRLERLEASLVVSADGLIQAHAANVFGDLAKLWQEARRAAEAHFGHLGRPSQHRAHQAALLRDLSTKAADLEALVQAGILDQLTNWPEVLDRARKLADEASSLAAVTRAGRKVSVSPAKLPEIVVVAMAQAERIAGQPPAKQVRSSSAPDQEPASKPRRPRHRT